LRASSLGFNDATTAVDVGPTGDTSATLRLGSDIQKLSAFVVEGYIEGRAKALQQKRTAENIMDIVSADSVGNLPDRNVAEAVARLPGISLVGTAGSGQGALDQGEGRYLSIRGAEPNLNQIMMDGATMAAPGGARLGRAVPLDALSAGQVSSIEVIKSVTPDLDANAVGGSVNLKSASAFDRRTRFIGGSVAGNRNGNTDKTNLSAQLSYSDVFGPQNKWGLGRV
jgi:TonB-dependent receptor